MTSDPGPSGGGPATVRRADTGGVTVRRASAADAADLCALSLRAIRQSAATHYDAAQLEAWAGARSIPQHRTLIDHTLTLVAEHDGAVAGFASVALEPWTKLERGEVDQLFVDPAHGGRGVARALLTAVDEAAAGHGLDALVTHASWRAAPVFERHGYTREEVETVHLDGQVLTRVRMRRRRPSVG
ncbi:GNAT family N-acetyltransferase [Cryptosporangium aurantiacum]|uniref:Putative acetyltransferase n=1 Tax=Cryptosporangium aurantiacum TaxID=134849 RepID=A0A1M7RL93_9ACTN|nr:GNAT family N-acetyltransferase [Cryptosporangium aurantiacum]SHN46939.1 putative acetyltransferase [Cryptosporangium aurantiacum]